MQASIKEMEEQRPLHLPPDLDLKPYVDEHGRSHQPTLGPPGSSLAAWCWTSELPKF